MPTFRLSYETDKRSIAKLTTAHSMPSIRLSAFSMRNAQAAQVIPVTRNVALSIEKTGVPLI
jgi:hypothetical protein